MPQPNFRSGHAEHVAQDPKQRRVAVDIDAMRISVHFDLEGHDNYPRCGRAQCAKLVDLTMELRPS